MPWGLKRHSSTASRWSLADEMIEHIVHRTNMCRARELKDSIKTTPGRDWRLPGNPPLYGCLTSPPWRDHSHCESRFDGIADAMPRRRSQLLCWAIHFNGNQISGATKYLAKPYSSPWRFVSRALLIASTNKHSAHRVIVAHRVPSARDPSQTIANKQKPNTRTCRIGQHAPTTRGDAVQNSQSEQKFSEEDVFLLSWAFRNEKVQFHLNPQSQSNMSQSMLRVFITFLCPHANADSNSNECQNKLTFS